MQEFVISKPYEGGFSFLHSDKAYQAGLKVICDQTIDIEHGYSVWGLVMKGQAKISYQGNDLLLKENMAFHISGNAKIESKGSIFYIEKAKIRDQIQIVGPIADKGCLNYIDGCTDTLLIAPQILGEPCLNHLHFPGGIEQTLHTHPSFRMGLVLRGSGLCHLQDKKVELKEGQVFLIPKDVLHAFETGGESMDIIAYHPDSDFGPQHDDHPMINRTIVEGVSARYLDEIRT